MRARALCLALTLALAGCCSTGARDRAAKYAAINQAHAEDQALPAEARAIGKVNAESWRAQWRLLGGKVKTQ